MRIAPVVLSALLLLLATAPRPSAGFFTSGSTQTGGLHGISKRQGAKWRPLAPLTANAMQRKPTTTKDRRPAVSALSAGTSSSSSSSLLSKQDVRAVLSASAFFAMDIITRRSFQYLKLTMFPPSLAACAVLFLAQILVLPKIVTDDFLPPGANLLAKWLPVFFVPSLITLPLADTARLEVVKVATIVVVGFVASLLSTAGTVVLVRRQTTQKTASTSTGTNGGSSSTTSTAAPTTTTTASGPFSARLVQLLSTLTLLTAIASATFKNLPRPVHAAYLVLCTVTTFVYGSQMPQRVKKFLHPLVTCTALTWGSIALLMRLSSSSFAAGLRLYQTTAGPILLKCLGPAVVSLACSMYARRILMRDNWRSILSAIGAGTVTGLFGTAVAVRWLTQTSDAIRLSLLSRNITSPLAMAMATMLNANVSLAVSMVVVTGLLGANFGATILSAVGITDPVARGLAVGASAHGLGTAALVNEKEAFPFAGAAMALSAFAATIAVAIPPLRNVLTRIALG
jgi:putative effector of murein hydrolase